MGSSSPDAVGTAARVRPPVQRLGRYELIQTLAKGGMGEVHLARTRGLGGFERMVVVKCALPTLPEHMQALLLAEARLAATLQHSNIVQVHDVGTDGGTVFLAMEYLHGQDTRAVVRRCAERHRELPLDQALAIAIAVCAGLHYAHERRDTDGSPLEIVHRDVSPSNVFVTYDGGVKLIDFGIAKATTLPSETQLGTIKGKPGYMSPEQCRCEPLDRRSDVFCVGIMLYELTTGRRAFFADNEYLLTKQILESDPASPTSLDPAYPIELEAIVMRALAKDRRARQPTAFALQDELAALATARRLDLSQLGLARWMEDLFGDELAAWHAAERAGESLVEHVIKRTTTNAAIVAELPVGTAERTRAEPVAAAATSRRRRWRWLGAAGAVVALGGAAVIATTGGDAPASPPTTAAPSLVPTVEPSPAPSASPRESPPPTIPPQPVVSQPVAEPAHAATPAAKPARPMHHRASPPAKVPLAAPATPTLAPPTAVPAPPKPADPDEPI